MFPLQGFEYGAEAAIGRCATNPVALPRRIRTVAGVDELETWIVTAMGVYIYTGLGLTCVCDYSSSTVQAGCVFDPFYSLQALQLGLSSRDLSTTRTPGNPTGVIGTWLTLDGAIPTLDLTNYWTTDPSHWAKPRAAPRVFHRNIQLAGEVEIMNTSDDRILLSGGGNDYTIQGGEPASPSAEILLPPLLNLDEPSP